VLHAHTATTSATLTELLQKIDARSGQVTQEKPDFLKTGDAALVKIKPLRPLAVEAYSDIPQLGRFAIRDMGSTIAVGVVQEITQKAQIPEKKT
jgi:elongation factor 1-alpha